ncbi:hypothetical protein GOBAR_DD13264 [Gossypium barbadense]|nr:hypothetical protein GOBAR_DD13264 [Gossypium barbadense]
MDCSDHECDKLEMSFKGADGFPSFKVKKCALNGIFKPLIEMQKIMSIEFGNVQKDCPLSNQHLPKRKEWWESGFYKNMERKTGTVICNG